MVVFSKWDKYWWEFFQDTNTWVKYTWGRKVVGKIKAPESEINNITKDETKTK